MYLTELIIIPQNVDDEESRFKILQQLPHFKNCDFTGVDFAFENYKRILKLMGAVVDEM